MRGQIFFRQYSWYIIMTTALFELILLIIFYIVSCSNELNWKKNVIFSFKNVIIDLSLRSGMFAEKFGPILWQKELKLFALSSLLSILSPLIMKYDGNFFCYTNWAIHLWWSNLFYIWYIFVKFWFIVKLLAVFIFLCQHTVICWMDNHTLMRVVTYRHNLYKIHKGIKLYKYDDIFITRDCNVIMFHCHVLCKISNRLDNWWILSGQTGFHEILV